MYQSVASSSSEQLKVSSYSIQSRDRMRKAEGRRCSRGAECEFERTPHQQLCARKNHVDEWELQTSARLKDPDERSERIEFCQSESCQLKSDRPVPS